MNARLRYQHLTVIAAVAVGIVLVAASSATSPAVVAGRGLGQSRAAPAQDAPTTGAITCAGIVELDFVQVAPEDAGSPPATPAPGDPSRPDLGTIDFGLTIVRDGRNVSGNVNLDHTLVFERVGRSQLGPSVQGHLDTTSFEVRSERVITTTTTGKLLTREFTLKGGPSPDRPNTLVGEYRETVTGLRPQTIVLVGQFSLLCPLESGAELAAAFHVSRRAGPAPLVVSFQDLSGGTPTTWSWTFGDGASSTEQNPTHTYSTPGRYTVRLTVGDGAATPSTLTRTDLVAVDVEAPPVADLSASPRSGAAPLEVTFTDLSAGGPTAWRWSFGDGGTSTTQHPTHTYTQPGTYSVSLEVTNAHGTHAVTMPDYIQVQGSLQPVAEFRAWPTAGIAPLAVAFTDLSTNGVTSWHWDFGDGATSTEQHPTHTYSQPGIYSVALTVRNNAGSDTERKTEHIRVTAPVSRPTANFSGAPRTGTVPLTVMFADQSTGEPASWLWSFGDGSTSTARHPTHTYSRVGSFTVALTVANDAGSDTKTAPDYVTAVASTKRSVYLPIAWQR